MTITQTPEERRAEGAARMLSDFRVGLPVLAEYGREPVAYYTDDGGTLCAGCVNDNWALCRDADSQWHVVACDVLDPENIDPDEEPCCDNCYAAINP